MSIMALFRQPVVSPPSLTGLPSGGYHRTMTEDKLQEDGRIIYQRVKDFCEDNGYSLSPQADSICRDLAHVKQETGDFYCPCQAERLPETVCVCRAVRQGLVDVMGGCFCGLILSPVEGEK
jgi:ferredoxin-thioredoxin reductase catalytic subunit